MWRCSCPLCRLLVHPVLRRLETGQGTNHVAELEYSSRETANVPLEPEVQTLPEAPPQLNQQATEVRQEPVVEVRIPPELTERIESIEREIDKLHKEIDSLHKSMTSIAVEIKEVLSEVSNPFNALRGQSNGNRKINGDRGSSGKMTASTFINILRVLHDMVGDMSKEQAQLLIRSYIEAGVVSGDVGEALEKLVDVVDAMRRSGLTPEKYLPYTYALFKTLNLGNQTLDEYIIRELLKRGKVG